MAGRTGQKIGNYRLIRLLGEGGFAEVYLGEHIYLGSQAAVKLLHTRVAQSDMTSFQQEGRMLANLIHPHIIRLLEFGIEDRTPYLIMDYAPGGTLRTHHPKGSQLPLSMVVQYVKQVGQALQYAHDQKFIHRDIKPENMLIGRTGTLLLSDFGIALIAQSSRYQSTKDMAGTIAYMAPEQIEAHPRPASDQYSLGIVIYEWLSGTLPFRGTLPEIAIKHSVTPPPSLTQQVPTLPPNVERVIFTALAKKPEERFGSVLAFVTALDQASLDVSAIVREPSEATPPPKAQPFIEASFPKSMDTPAQVETVSASVATPQETLSPVLSSAPKTHIDGPPTPLTPMAVLPPAHKQRSSPGYIALVVVLVVLLIGGGGYMYSAVRTSNDSIQKTATVVVRKAVTLTAQTRLNNNATATIQADINAYNSTTARAALNAYNEHTAQQGVMFGFDPQHTHMNPYEHIITLANISRLQQKWAASIGSSTSSSPVVANGVVYIHADDGNLYAFDAVTGQQKWVISTGESITLSSPTVANGVVYVSTYNHQLSAFDAATGQQKWTVLVNKISTSPTVTNGVIYIGSNDDRVYAFDAATGQQKWVVLLTGNPAVGFIYSSLAVANGNVYVSSWDSNLYALDAATGQQKWTETLSSSTRSSPAVANGNVYVNSWAGDLSAFDAVTGQQKWSVLTSSQTNSSPAVADGMVYLGSGDGKLHAFNITTGQLRWIASTGGAIESSPLVANGVIYIGSDDGKLYAFNALTGQQEWTAFTNSSESSAAIANGIVYIGSTDGKLYAFSLDGK